MAPRPRFPRSLHFSPESLARLLTLLRGRLGSEFSDRELYSVNIIVPVNPRHPGNSNLDRYLFLPEHELRKAITTLIQAKRVQVLTDREGSIRYRILETA